MSTTTLRLPDDLKLRLERLAGDAGQSTHAFMLETLAEAADLKERQSAFHAEAERRWAEYQRTGEYISLEDLRDYAADLVAGKKPAKPKLRRDASRARATKQA